MRLFQYNETLLDLHALIYIYSNKIFFECKVFVTVPTNRVAYFFLKTALLHIVVVD